jgi:CheY-like chemotaxis protein
MKEAAVRDYEFPSPENNSPPRMVLHIDDDPNDTELFRAAARKANVDFVLHSVPDGEQALAYLNCQHGCAKGALKLILLDLKMPRLTGFDLLRWIRSHAHLKHTPVVVLSGSASAADVEDAYAAGANSYLEKPLGFDALVDLIRKINQMWLAVSQQPSF